MKPTREGIVLLKNENDVLPLNFKSKISISGVEGFRLGTAGTGRINPRHSIGFLRAVDEFSNFRQDESAETGILVICRGCGENLDDSPIKGEFYLSDEEEAKIISMTNKYLKTIAIVKSGYPMETRYPPYE